MLRRLVAGATAIIYIGACAGDGSRSTGAAETTRETDTSTDDGRIDPTTGTDLTDRPRSTPGTLPGEMMVSPDGAFRYSIAIAVPPAANNFVPSLSLEYASNGGTGALGLGWMLKGVSRIHRCPDDLVRDGERRQIQGLAEDALCMDGVRLVALNPGLHGKPDAEYRLETDDKNLRIIGRQHTTSPISSFDVHEPGGTILRYGATADSRVATAGSPDVWVLSEAVDRFGNTISYSYTSDQDDPAWAMWAGWDHRLTTICYGQNAAAGTRCTRRVELEYMPHVRTSLGAAGPVSSPDFITQGYRAGRPYGTWHHLAAIRTYTGGALVHRYALSYGNFTPGAQGLRLEQVQICDAQDVCMPATTFRWREIVEGFTASPEHYAGANLKTQHDGTVFDGDVHRVLGDFNGDGKTDVLTAALTAGATWQLWASGQNGLDTPTDTGIAAHFRDPFSMVGYIQSEQYDTVVPGLSTAFNWYHPTAGRRSAVISLIPTTDLAPLALEPQTIVTGTSDGRPNIGDAFQILIANGDGTFQEHVVDDGVDNPILGSYLGDLNGDGLEDLLYCRSIMNPGEDPPVDNTQWMAGTWFYALQKPGVVGFDFAAEGGGDLRCGLRDFTYGPIDSDGDGDRELFYIKGHDADGVVLTEDQQWANYRMLGLVDGELTATESPLYLPNDWAARKKTSTGMQPGWPRYGLGLGRFIDFNSDGLVDYLTAPAGTLIIYVNTGNGWKQHSEWKPTDPDPDDEYIHNFSAAVLAGAAIYDRDGDQHPDFSITAYFVEQIEEDEGWNYPDAYKTVYDFYGKPDGFRVVKTSQTYHPAWAQTVPSCSTVNIDRDGQADLLCAGGASPAVLQVHKGEHAGSQIEQIVNGRGEHTRITYVPLADVHVESGAPALYPLDREPHEGPVVSFVHKDTGLVDDDGSAQMWWWWHYRYENLRYDLLRGNLGFEYRTIQHERTAPSGERWKTTDYERYTQSGPTMLGLRPQARALAARLSVTENLVGPKRTLARLARAEFDSVQTTTQRTLRTDLRFTESRSYDSSGGWSEANRRCLLDSSACLLALAEPEPTAWSYTFHEDRDAFGNVRRARTITEAGDETLVERTFHNETGTGWYLGNLLWEKVTHQTAGGSDPQQHEYRESRYHYYPNWTLHWRDNEPNRAKYRNSVIFEYDGFGHVSKRTRTSPNDWGSQWESVSYTADGAFVAGTTNAKQHTTSATWDARCGLPTEHVGATGHRTVRVYDGFCREIESQGLFGATPLAPRSYTQYDRFGEGLAARTRVSTWADGNEPTVVELDRLGRTIRQEYPVAGVRAQVTTVYDGLGQVGATSLPDAIDAPETAWQRFEHDGLNRLVKVTSPDWKEVRTEYERHQIRTIDELGRVHTAIKDGRGQLVRSEEPLDADPAKNAAMCYGHGAFGRLLWAEPCTASARQARVSFRYDAYNRVEDVLDTKLGHRCRRYDEFGRLTLEKDATGQPQQCELEPSFAGQTVFDYDELDRLISRTDADGERTFTYDVEAPGTLYESRSADGHVHRIHLDALERPALDETIFPDGRTFRSETFYDARGRVERVAHPPVHPGVPFVVQYRYGANDQLVRMEDASGETLWALGSMNARGQITNDLLGNGVVQAFTYHPANGRVMASRVSLGGDDLERWTYGYHDDGTLRSREHWSADTATHLQTFDYDVKRRLIRWQTWSGDAPAPCDGICGQDLIAAAGYDAFGNLETRSELGTYVYEQERLRRIEKPAPGNPLIEYTYDLNGNLLERDDEGIITTVAYTAAHQPRTLVGPDADYSFLYDAGDRKAMERDNHTGRVTYYAGSTELATGGDLATAVRVTYNVATPSGATVSVSRQFADPTLPQHEETVQVAHKDRLGSASLVTDATGQVAERRAYDPWGRELDPETWAPVEVLASSDRFSGGFTGHQARLYAGLINMQARMYDPVSGRFTEADTVIPDPSILQSWNRYSYVLNSPLNYTDPTGHRYESSGCVMIMGSPVGDCGGGGSSMAGFWQANDPLLKLIGEYGSMGILPDSELISPSGDGWAGNELMQARVAIDQALDKVVARWEARKDIASQLIAHYARMERDDVVNSLMKGEMPELTIGRLRDADYHARASGPMIAKKESQQVLLSRNEDGARSDAPSPIVIVDVKDLGNGMYEYTVVLVHTGQRHRYTGGLPHRTPREFEKKYIEYFEKGLKKLPAGWLAKGLVTVAEKSGILPEIKPPPKPELPKVTVPVPRMTTPEPIPVPVWDLPGLVVRPQAVHPTDRSYRGPLEAGDPRRYYGPDSVPVL